MAKTLSGSYWVNWANIHAKNSSRIDDLAEPFRSHVKEFIKALEAAGATVEVKATRRDAKRAYLFHWSWCIALDRKSPAAASSIAGVDIEWNHHNAAKSKAAAQEMVQGFGLAVPPSSNVAPALQSNHISGKAIDMNIKWSGNLKVKKKDGTVVEVPYMSNANANTKLHTVGASYSVLKHTSDAPHWSVNGH